MNSGPSTIDRLSASAIERIRLLPSPREVSFTVYGVAKPAGSKTAMTYRNKSGGLVLRPNGSPVIGVIDACKTSKLWKKQVSTAAQDAFDGEPFDCPVEVSMRFIVPRPKTHFGTGKNAASVKASSPGHPTSKPDVLKLARLVEDQLSGIVYVDDAATVKLAATKEYGEPARCEITVRPI